MSFTSDCGGLALKADIKLSTQTSTWKTRLIALLRSNAEITICTFSLPKREDYLAGLFRIRTKGVTIIANQKFEREANALKSAYPELCIILSPKVHGGVLRRGSQGGVRAGAGVRAVPRLLR